MVSPLRKHLGDLRATTCSTTFTYNFSGDHNTFTYNFRKKKEKEKENIF